MARDNKDVAELRSKFVCVRLVKMNGVDVSYFQFDWNVTLYAFFLNADGAIYARWGSPERRSLSVESFKKTMERVLALHEKGAADTLKAKTGPALAWSTPETMPALAENYKNAKVPDKCVHCHHVWTGLLTSTWKAGKPMPASALWRYPKPESIGLTLDAQDGAKVKSAGGAAATAGAREGDVVETADGVPILSTADLEWALHHAPDKGELKLGMKRGAETASVTVPLEDGWRRNARRSVFGVMLPGFRVEPLGAKAREAAGIAENALALRISKVMKNAPRGFKQGDIIVSVDGKTEAMEEDQFVALLRVHHTIGDKLKVGVRRGAETMDVELELR